MQVNARIYVKGQRVSLIKPSYEHMNEFLENAQKSETYHSPWTQAPNHKEAFIAYLKRIQKDHQFAAFIILNTTQELIGVININEIVSGAFQSGYLGYYLFAGFAQQGFMTEALGLLLDYAFHTLQLHRLEANIQPGNLNSIILVHKCGFRREGFSKAYLCIHGKWCDHVRYAITKEHYEAVQSCSMLQISKLCQETLEPFIQGLHKGGLNKPRDIFLQYLKEQDQQQRIIWVATWERRYVGYVTLVWASQYQSFLENNIPEIKDLNVAQSYRKRGVGTLLLLTAEREAFKRVSTVGLGVGLYEDYGHAQRLYFNLGYCRDGHGMTYDYENIPPGKNTRVDDELCLWLVKRTVSNNNV